jgi:predicted TIM-barrel fold metal-dependent hydrolase
VSGTPVIPKIVSVDDHVVEPAHLWERWLPERYRDTGPKVIRRGLGEMKFVGGTSYQITFDDNGPVADCWVYGDLVAPHKRHVAAVGFDRDDMTLSPITYDEMRAGCYDPVARLADMDMNHVESSLCFPTFPRFCGQTFMEGPDRDGLGLACVKAYNDWMVEEWCGDSGGRLIPLIIIPLWDAELAAAEVRRNAERGVHAVCFSEIPPHLDLPSIHTGYWTPFFDACSDTDTVVCMHIGFPDLKLAYSEGQMGWVPYILERADDVWEEHRAWGGVRDRIPEPPSTYYYDHIYCCFFRDRHGLKSLDEVGVENVTFETDYPHTDSTWPHTKEVAEKMFAGIDDDTVYKIVRGNAIRMLSLPAD